jgi:hypothetical protein
VFVKLGGKESSVANALSVSEQKTHTKASCVNFRSVIEERNIRTVQLTSTMRSGACSKTTPRLEPGASAPLVELVPEFRNVRPMECVTAGDALAVATGLDQLATWPASELPSLATFALPSPMSTAPHQPLACFSFHRYRPPHWCRHRSGHGAVSRPAMSTVTANGATAPPLALAPDNRSALAMATVSMVCVSAGSAGPASPATTLF